MHACVHAVCVCACLYVPVCICMCTCVYVHVPLCVNASVCVHMHVCMPARDGLYRADADRLTKVPQAVLPCVHAHL